MAVPVTTYSKITKLSLLISGALMLGGCGSTDFLAQKHLAEKMGQEINELHQEGNSVYINQPPLSLLDVVPVKKNKTWIEKVHVSLHAENVPLSVVIGNLEDQTGLIFYYADGVDADTTLVTIKKTGSLSSIINSIEAVTPYQIEIDKNKKVTVRAFITKSFPMMRLPGSDSFTIGQAGGSISGSGDENASSGGLFEADQSQHSTRTGGGNDPLKEIAETVTTMAGKGSTVSINQALGMITVTTTPHKMDDINTYIDQINNYLGRMIRVDVKVIAFTSKKSNAYNLNLNLVKTATKGLLNFSTSGSALSGMSNFTTFKLQNQHGSMSGSDVFIEALREQGVVTVSTEPSLTMINGGMGEILSVHKEAYAKSVEVKNPSGKDSESAGVSSIEQGVVVAGFGMHTLAQVVSNDILLQLSGTVSELGKYGVVSFGGTTLKTPQIDENTFNQSLRITDGQTMILTGYNQNSANANNRDSFHNKYLGGNGGREEHTQTIVMITAHLL